MISQLYSFNNRNYYYLLYLPRECVYWNPKLGYLILINLCQVLQYKKWIQGKRKIEQFIAIQMIDSSSI